MADNKTIVSVAHSVTEWCVPSHGITLGCRAEALSPSAISAHTNFAIAATTLAVLIDLANLLIRKLYFRDSFNVFMTTLTLHVCGASIFILHLGLRQWPNSLVPPWVTGLVFALSFSLGVMSLDYVTASWLEVQRKDSFLVYNGLRKYRSLYFINVATYFLIGTVASSTLAVSPQIYAYSARILWLLYAVMCPARAIFVWIIGFRMHRIQASISTTHNSASNTKRTIFGYVLICMMGFPVWTFYGIAPGFVDSNPILWHIIWSFSHVIFLVFAALFMWWTLSAAIFKAKSPPPSAKGFNSSKATTSSADSTRV